MQVFANSGVSGYSPALVGGTGTTFKIFPSLLGPGFNNGGASLSPTTGTPAAILNVPGAGVYEGRQFEVNASGYIYAHGTSPTINFGLYNGTSLTVGSDGTAISTLASAQSLTTAATYPFAYNAILQGDSVSGVVQVVNAKFVCNGVGAIASLTNTALTGVNFLTSSPALNLVFGIEFTVSDALNKAALMEFVAGV
jgi:hypothetical protein